LVKHFSAEILRFTKINTEERPHGAHKLLLKLLIKIDVAKEGTPLR